MLVFRSHFQPISRVSPDPASGFGLTVTLSVCSCNFKQPKLATIDIKVTISSFEEPEVPKPSAPQDRNEVLESSGSEIH